MAGRLMFFGCRPTSRPKIENFTRTKCFYFLILHTPAKFQASRFNSKKSGPISLMVLLPSIFSLSSVENETEIPAKN